MPALQPGISVILRALPPGLITDLPEEDQAAIRAIVGGPVTFVGLSYGQAEIEFFDRQGDGHSIWVDESFLDRA
jgi:hypothetical protein